MKNTEDLLNQLKLETTSYSDYLAENESYFIENDLSTFWKKALDLCGMKKTDIINKADIGYTFFYDILRGQKHPSRDMLIKVFIAMRIDIDFCQEALRLYDWAALYPKIKRDSIIIYAITHKLSLFETNILLKNNNEAEFAKKS